MKKERNKPLEKALERLFRTRRTLERMERAEAPEAILNYSRAIYEKALEHLDGFDVNGEAFLQTDAGAALFLEYNVNEDQLEAISARCGKCSFFTMKDNRDPKHNCEIYGDGSIERVICNEFRDTGETLDQRLLGLAVDRCHTCQNIELPEKKEYWLTDDKCLKENDRIAIECSDYAERSLTK
jgi:hypothetical protein